MEDWQEERYNQVFEETVENINLRRKLEKDFSLNELEKLLHYHYVRQGHEWEGRGSPYGVMQQATIDAHEHVIHNWDKEEQQS